MQARRILLELFDTALRAVNGRQCVDHFLREANLRRAVVFAVGKAASSMALGARDALGDRIHRMLVITKQGHTDSSLDGPGVLQLESPHPMPGERSLVNGHLLESSVLSATFEATPLFLISGGSSSLVEVLQDGYTLDDLVALNARGLAAGWDIATLNAERAKISRLKGGGISRLLGNRPAIALFISDVPGDDPEIIGSGLLGHGGRADDVQRHIVANVDAAVRATVAAAHAHGLRLESSRERFDGEAAEVARTFVEALRATHADGLVWGGESTVKLPERAGSGGRNTHLALGMARLLRANEGLTILAAGTDGTDGPTEDAGAIVDAGTIERAELAGCDIDRAWHDFDSAVALEAAGDLVHTGPTGTNVGDLLIGLKHGVRSLRGLAPQRVL
jgi:glycerate 2-kinase